LISTHTASDEEPPSPLPINIPTIRPMSSADDLLESGPQQPQARRSSFDRSSPTPWPPPPPEPSLILATPPRRQSSTSSKVEFETPPPPKGLPELPGPPPSEDEADEEPHPEVSSTKTPKPPGAWTSTPSLSRRGPPLVRVHTFPGSDGSDGFGELASESGLATPVASLSRASSLPSQTPAPPGAWLPTPSAERRRSVLKVRFEVESEQSASDVLANGHAHVGDSDGPQTESPCESSFEASTPKARVNGLPAPLEVKMEEFEAPVTPRSTPPPPLRKSPSIRVVDAFGREQTSLSEVDKSQDSGVVSPVPSTPRNKSSVRIVDAMGREVEEVLETIGGEGKNEVDVTLGHNEALRRVRQSIADLASGLNEVDRYAAGLL
jgi:serine/arginine repetitive matrix protein 2